MSSKSPPELKRLAWLASTKRDLMALPEEVIDTFGYALYLAQTGKKHEQAKPLKGFGSAGVPEVVEAGIGARIELSHRTVRGCGIRATHLPKEVHARSGHAQGRSRYDPRASQGGHAG